MHLYQFFHQRKSYTGTFSIKQIFINKIFKSLEQSFLLILRNTYTLILYTYTYIFTDYMDYDFYLFPLGSIFKSIG